MLTLVLRLKRQLVSTRGACLSCSSSQHALPPIPPVSPSNQSYRSTRMSGFPMSTMMWVYSGSEWMKTSEYWTLLRPSSWYRFTAVASSLCLHTHTHCYYLTFQQHLAQVSVSLNYLHYLSHTSKLQSHITCSFSNFIYLLTLFMFSSQITFMITLQRRCNRYECLVSCTSYRAGYLVVI